MTTDRLIVRRALYDAIDWQQSLADAYRRGDPEYSEAMALAKRYRAVLKKRYGHASTPMESLTENAVSLTLDEVRALSQKAVKDD